VSDAGKYQQLMERVYFVAIIPFFGGAIAPWILGPAANAEVPIFLLWSFTVLIFCTAGWLGFNSATRPKLAVLHTLVGLLITGLAVSAFLAVQHQKVIIAAAIFTFLHWAHLWWVRKTNNVEGDFLKNHQKFVWTVLACHMMVLLNMVYLVKTA